ncbi:25280_t:CDS:2, partial [Gigaspora rosea]
LFAVTYDLLKRETYTTTILKVYTQTILCEGNSYVELKEGRNEDEVTQSEEKDNIEEELLSQLGESNLDEIIATKKDTEDNQVNEEI